MSLAKASKRSSMSPVGSLWRRPWVLLLALLLALDAGIGAGAAAPLAEHAPRAPAAAALAVSAAATASSQCSGTSSDLSATGCSAWVDFFDSTGGEGRGSGSARRVLAVWCRGARPEPGV